MGSKAGFASAILGALGLRAGHGSDAYAWAEADPDVRALLRAYPDAAMLREVAAIIRGWSGEEPRQLWERLRDERRERGPRGDAVGVAGWLFKAGNEYAGGGGWKPVPTARPNTEANVTRAGLAASCSRLADHADWEVAAREVASTVVQHRWSFSQRGPEHGYGGPGTAPGMMAGRDESIGCDATAARCSRLASTGWPPVCIHPTIPTAADFSALLGTPGDLEGVVVYMDPDYVGTTGYKSADGTALTYPRADVVRDALAFAAIGATVAVSEAVPVEELTAAGWEAVDIMAERKGQRLTFRRSDCGEWVTMSRAPTVRPAVQMGMFG